MPLKGIRSITVELRYVETIDNMGETKVEYKMKKYNEPQIYIANNEKIAERPRKGFQERLVLIIKID